MIRSVRPGPVHGRVRAPPSKSYTHRALVTAFLSDHRVEILSPLDSDDTRATARGLVAMGAQLHKGPDSWVVAPKAPRARSPTTIDCRESGTTLRLLTAVAALGERPVRFTGTGRLPHRPMESLLRPLRSLGAEIRTERADRVLPFTIRGPIGPGRVRVSARESSQPVSALLLALSSLSEPSEIRIEGEIVSEPYIDATVAWLERGGQHLDVSRRRIAVRKGRGWTARRVRVPGDASSAAYLWAAAVCSHGRITVDGIDRTWPQADLALLDILRATGVRVGADASSVTVSGAPTREIHADLTRNPDLYPLVGALAAIVPNRTSQLRGAPHLKHKESNRLSETLRLVRAVGARAQKREGGLVIHGTDSPRALSLTDLTDHRLVMSAAVAALGAPAPSRIGDARAVRKSFPGFWSAMGQMQRRSTQP